MSPGSRGSEPDMGLDPAAPESARQYEVLQSRERRLTALIEKSADGIITCDPDGDASFANSAAACMLGLDPDAAASTNALSVVHPDDRERVRGELAALRGRAGVSITTTHRCVRPDGAVVWLDATLTNLLDDPDVRAIVINYRDVTERVRMDVALREYHRLLEAVVEGTSDEIFVEDFREGYKLVNTAAARIFGMVPEQMIGRHIDEFVPPQVAQQIERLHRAFLADGNERPFELEIHENGRVRVKQTRLHALRNEGGEIVGVVGIARDTTIQKETERDLQEAHARLEAIIRAAPVIIDTIDREGRVTSWNPAGERILGWTEAEVLGRIPPMVTEESRQQFFDAVDRVFQGESVMGLDIHRTAKDGRELDINLSLLPLIVNGQISSALGILMDMSDYKRVEAALRQMNADLERVVERRTAQLQGANKELESFSYSVSHDLRAPLRSIRHFTVLAIEDASETLGETARGDLDRALAAADRMRELIDGLLEVAHLQRSELIEEIVDLGALAHEVALEIDARDPARGVEWRIEQGVIVRGDHRLLRVLLDNLLGNAWKYSANQGRAIIEFGRQTWEGRDAAFVRDNGAGFDMRYADRLFEPFKRLHSSSQFDGTGIGLATVRRIVQRHGGTIWAEAATGRGATFWFTLEGLGPPEHSAARPEV